MCLAISIGMASSESKGMALMGISTAFNSTAATKGTTRVRPLRLGWRRGRPAEVVGGAAPLTEETESIGGVLPVQNLK
jgi:hypothetical protein